MFMFFFIQVAVPDGQEIINRVFIGGLARDVSWTRSLLLAMFLSNRLFHGQLALFFLTIIDLISQHTNK